MIKANLLSIIFLLLSICASHSQLTHYSKLRPDSMFDKVLREGDLSALLREVPNRTDLQLERLAAYFFHQRINQYRLQNGRTTLYWDERMWLAARNHNVYMSHTKYGHEETKGLSGFTGIEPSDRIQFVTYNGFKMSLYGENILMNFSADYPTLLVDNAKNIADESFEMWRKSPPHNKNMLHPDFFAHGTSFYGGRERMSQIFGTTNFGNESDFVKQEISISWNDSLAVLYPPQANENRKSIKLSVWSVQQAEMELFQVVRSKMPKHNSAYNTDFTLAADMNIKQESTVKDLKVTPLSAKRRFLKVAKRTKSKFAFKKLIEKTYDFEFTLTQLSDKSAQKVVDDRISLELPSAATILSWGGKCRLSENGILFRCEIDLIYCTHK